MMHCTSHRKHDERGLLFNVLAVFYMAQTYTGSHGGKCVMIAEYLERAERTSGPLKVAILHPHAQTDPFPSQELGPEERTNLGI